MSLWKIAWRSIQQRALASSLTGISMALGVMLVVAVLVVHGVINQSFLNNSGLGYNMVVGAKGGRLDLVLNSVYYLAAPVENIPYTYYQEFTEGKFKRYVDKAIPVCLGDVYGDFRVIGTTPDFFDELDYGGKKYEFAQGRNFKRRRILIGAVIGATVARETGLKVGDEFQPAHGAGPDAHEHDPFKIVGVLKPTGTPNDRGLFINMEGFYLIPEHAKPTDDEPTELPAAKPHDDAGHADHEHAARTCTLDEHEHAHEHDARRRRAHAARQGRDHDAQPIQSTTADRDHEQRHDEDHEHAHADDEHAAEAEMPTTARPPSMEHADHDHAAWRRHDEHAHDEHGDHEHGHTTATTSMATTMTTPRAVAARAARSDRRAGGAQEHRRGAARSCSRRNSIKKINKGSVAQAVLPIREMTVLFSTFVDPLQIVLLGLTVMIVIVSGIGILVSIYNSMSERQHEIAVVRALGAGRRTVMLLVLLESILLSLVGGLAGWLVGHGLIAALSPWIATQTGVSDRLLAVCRLRVGYNTRADRAGRAGGIICRPGRLSHRRGQGAERDPLEPSEAGRRPSTVAAPLPCESLCQGTPTPCSSARPWSLLSASRCVGIGRRWRAWFCATALACPFCSAVSLTFSEEIANSQVAVIATLVKSPPKGSARRLGRSMWRSPSSKSSRCSRAKTQLGKSPHRSKWSTSATARRHHLPDHGHRSRRRSTGARPSPSASAARSMWPRPWTCPRKVPIGWSSFRTTWKTRTRCWPATPTTNSPRPPTRRSSGLKDRMKHDKMVEWMQEHADSGQPPAVVHDHAGRVRHARPTCRCWKR